MGARSEVPFLRTRSDIVQGSGAILDWAGLDGGDPELEDRVAKNLAVAGRRMVYAGLLNETPGHAAELLFSRVRGAAGLAGRAAWPITRRLMIRAMRTQLVHIAALEQRIAGELTWLAGRIAGRDYLVGGCFGRADLTVASLLSLLVLPERCAIYASVVVPPVLRPLFERWREHPVAVYVRRIYAVHR